MKIRSIRFRPFVFALGVVTAASHSARAGDVACDPVCDPGPCFSLRAVAVNGEPMTPSNCVEIEPGDIVEAEVFVSDWGAKFPEGIDIYQATFDGLQSALSGLSGLILPLGWEAPYGIIPCSSNADCAPYQGTVCTVAAPYGTCRGLNSQPSLGVSLDEERPDFLFAGIPYVATLVANVQLHLLGFSVLGNPDAEPEVLDEGKTRYGGSLRLVASPDACGEFNYRFSSFEDLNTLGLTFGPTTPNVVELYPLSISVDCDCNDDGLVDWEAIESGASPDCNENGKPDDCDIAAGRSIDDNGNGTPDECEEPDFEAVPTVSQWGLVVLALLLIIAGKVRFGRARRVLV